MHYLTANTNSFRQRGVGPKLHKSIMTCVLCSPLISLKRAAPNQMGSLNNIPVLAKSMRLHSNYCRCARGSRTNQVYGLRILYHFNLRNNLSCIHRYLNNCLVEPGLEHINNKRKKLSCRFIIRIVFWLT